MSDRAVSIVTGTVPYTVTIHDGQHHWIGDTQPANGGQDAGPDPEAQVLGALGACTAITVSMVAARKQWPLAAVHVHLHYTQRGAAGTSITRAIVLDGHWTMTSVHVCWRWRRSAPSSPAHRRGPHCHRAAAARAGGRCQRFDTLGRIQRALADAGAQLH